MHIRPNSVSYFSVKSVQLSDLDKKSFGTQFTKSRKFKIIRSKYFHRTARIGAQVSPNSFNGTRGSSVFHPRDMREMRFTTIPSRKTSGWVPSSLRNARWVSRCALMLPGRYFTDSGNLTVARHSHSPVDVHVSECVACEQHRYFRANSLKPDCIGMGPFSP
jgi:hypothetical protein